MKIIVHTLVVKAAKSYVKGNLYHNILTSIILFANFDWEETNFQQCFYEEANNKQFCYQTLPCQLESYILLFEDHNVSWMFFTVFKGINSMATKLP